MSTFSLERRRVRSYSGRAFSRSIGRAEISPLLPPPQRAASATGPRLTQVLRKILVDLPVAKYLRDGSEPSVHEYGWDCFVGQRMHGSPLCLPGKFCRLVGVAGLLHGKGVSGPGIEARQEMARFPDAGRNGSSPRICCLDETCLSRPLFVSDHGRMNTSIGAI